jgi:hypothetical protein
MCHQLLAPHFTTLQINTFTAYSHLPLAICYLLSAICQFTNSNNDTPHSFLYKATDNTSVLLFLLHEHGQTDHAFLFLSMRQRIGNHQKLAVDAQTSAPWLLSRTVHTTAQPMGVCRVK